MPSDSSALDLSGWHQSLSQYSWKSCLPLVQPHGGLLFSLGIKSKQNRSLADNDQFPSDQKRELLPLVIGITGHRDIAEASKPAVEKALEQVFRDLQRSCPHTPLLLLSPLAQGADRIAAEAFLKLPHTRLMIPMPMALGEYRKTFTEDDPAFDALLAQGKSFVVPPPDAKESPWDPRPPKYDKRPDCYEALGLYIAEHCHVLVAVWDKVILDKVGGTSQVVKIFLTGQPNFGLTAENLVQPRQRRPVIHIWTDRQSGKAPSEAAQRPAPGTTEILTLPRDEDEDILKGFKQTLLRLDVSNEDFLNLDESRIDRLRYCRSGKYNSPPVIPEGYLTPQEKTLRLLSAQASPLANDYANKLRNNLFLMITLAALSMAGFATFRLTGYTVWQGALIGEVAILTLLASFLCLKLLGWQNKHLHYRGFLEALRVFFFWKLEGVPADIMKKRYTEERVLGSGENRWMRESIAYLELAQAGAKESFPQEAKTTRKKAVLEKWIEGQRDYFGREGKDAEKAHQKWLFVFLSCAILGSAFVVISRVLEGVERAPGEFPGTVLSLLVPVIMIAMAESLFFQFMPHLDKRRHKSFRVVLLALCLGGWLIPTLWPEIRPALISSTLVCGYLLLPISALAGSYMKLSAFSDNAKRYKKSHALFSQVHHLVKEETDAQRREELIAYLGKQALAENSTWIRQHVDRPIGLPVSRRNF